MSNLDPIIRKHVLKNIFDYGKANPGSIAGKVIAEHPECKKDMKGTMGKIKDEIKKASKLDKEEIEQEMSEYVYFVKEEKEKTISLPDAEKGKVVTRFPPEPSGYPHIGHAKAAWLDFEAALAYDGHMILRFDDTNPEKESEEFVRAIKEGLEWLAVEWKKETYTSDNMPKIYGVAEELIKKGKAYVSTASQEQLSDSRTNSRALPDRALPPDEHLSRWRNMLDGRYKKGEALLLFKGDLESMNTVMRDPALARIIDAPHYRQKEKYHVWPSYDLSVVFMDHSEGVTHPMRSKEYELRDELYHALFDALGWKRLTVVPFSRLAIRNAPISKRLITPLVKEGKVTGWDDPRLPTLAGLKRRGIQPEAIKEFALSFGLSKVESEPGWDALLSINRKLIDPTAPHYFFVPDPVQVELAGLWEKNIELALHPKADTGKRKIHVGKTMFIPKSDADKLKTGDIFRLKDLCNAEILETGSGMSCRVAPEGMVPLKVQWVPDGWKTGCRIIVPGDLLKEGEYDGSSMKTVQGFCEKSCEDLKEGSIVQFERFGFCRLDKKGKELVFIFTC